MYIKQRQPILKGLQSKTAQNESDAKHPKPSLRKVVRIVLDVRIDRRPNAGDNADYQSNTNGEPPGVVDVMAEVEETADQGRRPEADSAEYSSQKPPPPTPPPPPLRHT